MKIDIQTTASQQMTCDEIEKFVKAHIGGVRTSLDEPVGGYDAPYPLDSGHQMPSSVTASDGVYSDSKEKMLTKDVTVNGTEYVRILDEEVVRVLNTNGVGADGKVTKEQAEAVTSIGTWFANNENISSFEELYYFDKISNLSRNAFNNCPNLKNLYLPKNIQRIDAYCLYGTTNISGDLFLPKTVKYIGYNPFGNSAPNRFMVEDIDCYMQLNWGSHTPLDKSNHLYNKDGIEITHVSWKNGITFVSGFSGAKNITFEKLPNTITSINSYAFRDCILLDCDELPNSLISIGDGAFSYCTNLKITSIPRTVTQIGSEAFRNCTINIKSLPPNVTSLGARSFALKNKLEEFSIPSGFTNTGGYNALPDINVLYSYAETPFDISSGGFFIKQKIYVPNGTLSTYQTANGWSNFASIMEEFDPAERPYPTE